MFRIFTISVFLLIISGCTGVKKEHSYPLTPEYERQSKVDSITGEDGFKLLGSSEDKNSGASIGVNSYLWRATLDTLSFAPLNSADPLGGVIITEWYENPDAPGERFKINATILDTKLRSDGIKVAVFKQTLDKDKVWRDGKVSPKVGRDLEDKILTRARELRIKQSK